MNTEITTHDIALNAYHNDLASDYEREFGETAYRLFHPTNNELSIVFDIEHDEEGNADGWSFAEYERDENGKWQLVGQGGDGINPDENPNKLTAIITETLTAWAQ